MAESRNNGISKRITLGNILQMGMLLAAIISAWFILGSRVTILESRAAARAEECKTFVTEREHELSLGNIEVQLREINRRLDTIDRKLNGR